MEVSLALTPNPRLTVHLHTFPTPDCPRGAGTCTTTPLSVLVSFLGGDRPCGPLLSYAFLNLTIPILNLRSAADRPLPFGGRPFDACEPCRKGRLRASSPLEDMLLES